MFQIESRTKYKSGDRASRLVIRAENTAINDSEDDATTSSSTVSKTKKKKYDESYISFGFVDSNGSPLCMLCSKLLPNTSMTPAKLRRHLETVHPESKDKNEEFFVHKKEQTKCMLDENLQSLSTVRYQTILFRGKSMIWRYVKQELVTHLQKARFALQMDESTDIAGLAILLVKYESSLEKDMLMCSPLPTNSTGEEIFNKINIFFEENNLGIDICTDRIKALTGKQQEQCHE
ncbi:Zinc finger BED domain-containing protein 5 [Eumeta japonica]|uniref:Zinc finger BED domain-containing protein 5 n=1 Tax=Eumeta variegata TaxID=151549 RepID=A0A4C1SHZ4_EUMVA|nr:Zinc finger BED domain-containing protein 5 [Eumeta japonica]